jgi:hypothetical protein
MQNQKAHKLRGDGAFINIQNTPIVSEYQPKVNKLVRKPNNSCSKFLAGIRKRRLTKTLDFLENIGIIGDLASFTIKHFNTIVRGVDNE